MNNEELLSIGPSSKPSDAQIANYIARMCRELRALSLGPKFRMLNHFLDMARVEAEQMARASGR